MPRIDPLQLLTCLGVLLTPEGGIRTKDEVQRLASLMTKFSKKLVSKCVYILILKNSETELLHLFMDAGGWSLVFSWLSDGIVGKNWALVTELLELLLMCPVDVERLKSNSIPKLVKALSRDESLIGVNPLASQLVENWLKIVKDESGSKAGVPQATKPFDEAIVRSDIVEEIVDEAAGGAAPCAELDEATLKEEFAGTPVDDVSHEAAVQKTKTEDDASAGQPTAKAAEEDEKKAAEEPAEAGEDVKDGEKKEKKEKSSSKHRHRSGSSSSSKSSSHKSSKDKERSKERDKSRDKSKEKSKDNHHHRHHRPNGATTKSSPSSSSSSSSSSSLLMATKEGKLGLKAVSPSSLAKLGKIPRKQQPATADEKQQQQLKEKKKSSISIEVRKNDGEPRPKTVKVFNSKMRSTGLEEVPKPAPPRPLGKKQPATVTASVGGLLPATKRPSPPRETIPPPEKRPRLSDVAVEPDKPGGIKLIPAKPKPMFLQESDMFMDALTASATKKEVKKRKRRPSLSKDQQQQQHSSSSSPSGSAGGAASPPTSPTSVQEASLRSIAGPKFYKDTLEEDTRSPDEEAGTPEAVAEKESELVEPGVLKGVLVYHKKKGPKKSVKWKPDADLERIQYFELDETERVNVTKTFTDMKQMEHSGEREALQMSRKVATEDLMDEKTPWRPLLPLELAPPLAEIGSKSVEKEVQLARERSVLQCLYFTRAMVPDSPGEPEPELHQAADPVLIPLEDVAGLPDSINDYQDTPWPEPKGSPPPPSLPQAPAVFAGLQPFPQQQPGPGPAPGPAPFPAYHPPFGPGGFGMMGPEWRPAAPDGMMMPPGDMGGPPPPPPPRMFHHPPRPDGPPTDPGGFPNFPNQMYPGGFRGGRGGGGNRGNFRRGNGPWFRPPWHNRGGGGGQWGGNRGVCKQYMMNGFCRQRDNCQYAHPNPPPGQNNY